MSKNELNDRIKSPPCKSCGGKGIITKHESDLYPLKYNHLVWWAHPVDPGYYQKICGTCRRYSAVIFKKYHQKIYRSSYVKN